MRLLQAKSVGTDAGLGFAEFSTHELPSFAVLAHSVGDVEVTYSDAVGDAAAARAKANYEKLAFAARQALADGYEYLFIHSCCVDRRSSAELDEAANSALQWYRKAGTVYAYLPDCPADARATDPASPFAASRWFRDPWMLLPLVASRNLTFYAAQWTKLGTKADLASDISAVTGVGLSFIRGTRPIETASVAQRMSWAARRSTARVEDVAYALMGLFSVHMPLLYGEGERAFLRLQEEIIRHSNDYSLFAWLDESAHPDQHYGLLARTPLWFEKCGHIVPYAHSQSWAPYKMTNRGVKIDSIVQCRPVGVGGRQHALALDCPANDEDNTYLAVFLQKCSNNEYVRVRANELDRISRSEWALERGNATKIYVRQDVDRIAPSEGGVYPFHAIRFRQGPDPAAHQLVGMVRSTGFPDQYKHYKSAFDAKLQKLSYLPQARLSKEPGRLSVGLAFANADGQRLAVLLGSSAEGMGLACDALEITRAERSAKALGAGLPSFAELEESFSPKELGQDIELTYFRVKVTADRKCTAEQKLYDINVDIQGIDVLPAYEEVREMDEQQAAAAATSSKRESRNILKRLLK